MKTPVNKQGFTLIEFLIVIAVIAILAALATPNYLNWRATSITKEAAQQFARDIDKQRTEAKRSNTQKKIEVTSNGSSYKLIDVTTNTPRTFTLPSGTKIVVPSGKPANFTFQQPHGTVLDADIGNLPFQYEIQWQTDPTIKRTVQVVSLTGKVVIK